MERRTMDEDKLDRAIEALERIAGLLAISARMKLQDLSQQTPLIFRIYQEFLADLDALEKQ